MATFEFPSEHRLHNSAEFDAVFKENDLRVSEPEILFLAKRNERGFNRLGLVVSKKNMPRAVDRNRLKRQIRESFRLHLSNVMGLDVVVLSRPGIVKQMPEKVGQVLAESFGKLGTAALELDGSLKVSAK